MEFLLCQIKKLFRIDPTWQNYQSNSRPSLRLLSNKVFDHRDEHRNLNFVLEILMANAENITIIVSVFSRISRQIVSKLVLA